MHHVPRGADGEKVAVQFGVPCHSLPVDIVTQGIGNGRGFLGRVLHVVGKAGVFAKVAIFQRLARLGQVAAVVVQQCRADMAAITA